MSPDEAVAKVGRLKAVTVERGATPAEAATAALLAQRLVSRLANPAKADIARGYSLAPGVHVHIA